MDVLAEFDISIEFIGVLMLNTELPIYEYTPISVIVIISWDCVKITLLSKFGKIWNPSGMIASNSELFIDCYNGHITYCIKDNIDIFRVNGHYLCLNHANEGKRSYVTSDNPNNIIVEINYEGSF